MDRDVQVKADPRRELPQVDMLINALKEEYPDLLLWAIKHASKEAISEARNNIETGAKPVDLKKRAEELARDLCTPHPRRVVNATGVLIHTNLGRSPLSETASLAISEVAGRYTDLEVDLKSGRRGDRLSRLERLLRIVSGAESAFAVNNNAAALLLLANTLATGREVIVSRGELVEIGGSFRVPDILSRSGVILREVGTTNRTHIRDFEEAINKDTGLLLKVHPSNFQQHGYVKEVSLAALVDLGKKASIPVVEDLGSGLFASDEKWELPRETDVSSRLNTGVDAICLSGDKLLGGPQAGIVLGKNHIVRALKSNPLARALRLDKLSIAALDATLRDTLSRDSAQGPPLWFQLSVRIEKLLENAQNLGHLLEGLEVPGLFVQVEKATAPVGGGSVPGFAVESAVVRIGGAPIGVESLARQLRSCPVPIMARIQDNSVLFDVRTLLSGDNEIICNSMKVLLSKHSRKKG